MGKEIPEVCQAFTTTASGDIKSYPPTVCTFEIINRINITTGSQLQLDGPVCHAHISAVTEHTYLSIKEEVSCEPDCGVATASIALCRG